MTNEVRAPANDAELARLAEIEYQSFAGFGQPPERTDAWLAHIGRENLRVLERDGRIIGGLGILYFGQWFGGRVVSSAGISAVAIAPEDRVGGAGLALMNETVREMAQRGIPLSVLYPSTHALYRKAGYEPAGLRLMYKIDLTAIGFGGAGEMRLMTTEDEPAVAALHRECIRYSAGCVERGRLEWERIFRYGVQRVFSYLVQSGGRVAPIDGYLVYTQTHASNAQTVLEIRGWGAANASAAQRILAFLRSQTTIARAAKLDSGPSDLILRQAREEYVTIENRSCWMLRILNVKSALDGRGYPRGLKCELHFDVNDDLLAENSGKFVLRVADGRGALTPGGVGRIKVGIRGLAPLYSGHLSAGELKLAGQIDASEDDIATASAVFAGPAPWLSDRF